MTTVVVSPSLALPTETSLDFRRYFREGRLTKWLNTLEQIREKWSTATNTESYETMYQSIFRLRAMFFEDVYSKATSRLPAPNLAPSEATVECLKTVMENLILATMDDLRVAVASVLIGENADEESSLEGQVYNRCMSTIPGSIYYSVFGTLNDHDLKVFDLENDDYVLLSDIPDWTAKVTEIINHLLLDEEAGTDDEESGDEGYHDPIFAGGWAPEEGEDEEEIDEEEDDEVNDNK